MAKYTEILSEKRDAALARAEQITQIAVSEQRDFCSLNKSDAAEEKKRGK